MGIKVLELLWTAVKSIVLLAMACVLALLGWVFFLRQPWWGIAYFVLVIALCVAAALTVKNRGRLAAYAGRFAPWFVLLSYILVFAYALAILSGAMDYHVWECPLSLRSYWWLLCQLIRPLFVLGGSKLWAATCLLFSLVGLRLAVRDLLAARGADRAMK